MSDRIDALICPRWTVPIEPSCDAHVDLCLAVHDGRIVELLPRAQADQKYTPDAVHERPEHVLLPGLINAHTHAAMTLLRGYADDMSLERWLNERIWPTEMRLISPDFIADGTGLAIAEMLRGGITCFADMYFFPDTVADVAAAAGIRAAVGMIAVEFPTPWADTPAEYISKGLAVHDAYKAHPLVSTTFAPHAPYSVADDTLQRIRQLADELDVPVHMHVHETAQEISDSVEKSGQRPLERLEALGLVNPSLMAVHATQLTDEEIAALARSGSSVVHCPRSNLKLASGACRVADLVASGINVALGTDGAASNNRLDLWSEMESAALLGKLIAEDAEALPARAMLRMATINGARALGLEQETGSLEPGKAADFICVRLEGAAMEPVLDPVSQLVYCASRENVSDVWVAGKHLLANGALTRLDEALLVDRAREWATKVLDA
ncbi:MAG: TRZ/ATZ family hydrolase [Gammaproteobacteria bacterium]|nr:TRZ/ATZ family hydrolase [Gammaproteobacteria bacterium]